MSAIIGYQREDNLLIIGAIEFGLTPGTITLSDEKIIANTNSATAHYQDLEELLNFMELEGKKPDLSIILGIQVEKITLFQSVSEAVNNSVNKASQAFVELLGWFEYTTKHSFFQ